MIPAELEKMVKRDKAHGDLPFFVNWTTGTTVYGAFDPIPEIAGNNNPELVAAICQHLSNFHNLNVHKIKKFLKL